MNAYSISAVDFIGNFTWFMATTSISTIYSLQSVQDSSIMQHETSMDEEKIHLSLSKSIWIASHNDDEIVFRASSKSLLMPYQTKGKKRVCHHFRWKTISCQPIFFLCICSIFSMTATKLMCELRKFACNAIVFRAKSGHTEIVIYRLKAYKMMMLLFRVMTNFEYSSRQFVGIACWTT